MQEKAKQAIKAIDEVADRMCDKFADFNPKMVCREECPFKKYSSNNTCCAAQAVIALRHIAEGK